MTTTREMLSVGLDVGTTTTQIVFTKIFLSDRARMGQVPRVGVSDKIVLYASPIYFTPLRSRDTVDVSALEAIVRAEYARAGFTAAQIETGAVIVTGEIAKKQNAAEILQTLGKWAGEFVVTVAGPRVESQMAGRGSGAAAWSREHYARVTNIDIGGGSANAALFELGNLLAASAMNIGGRIIEIDHATLTVRHLAEPARKIIDAHRLPIAVDQRADRATLRAFCDILAELTVELIDGRESNLGRAVMLTPPMPISGRGTKIFFSGGVAEYFYHPPDDLTLDSITRHDDIGPLLGLALRENETLRTMDVRQPPETLRATVLGASSQTVTLSGSTIWAERALLPIKNVPVVHPLFDAQANSPAIASAIHDALIRWEVDARDHNVAIALEIAGQLDFARLSVIAHGIADYARTTPNARPLILILGKDYAQSLGQTLKALLPAKPLLAIDQVGLDEGDFIDIGLPMMDGRVVPLSVKTLIFYR